MKRLFVGLMAVLFGCVLSACADAPKTSVKDDSAQWQQFKAKKAQDELSAEMDKQNSSH